MLGQLAFSLGLIALGCGAEVQAQPATAEGVLSPVSAVEPQSGLPAASSCIACIPALTPVELVIDADLGSKISKTGETFPLHLAVPVVVDGREMLPAGTIGQGEVIHAKKAGGGGSAGELVLAARFLTLGDRTIRLRSLRVAIAGADNIHKVDAVNAASVVSPLPIGVLGFAITGHNVVYPKGTVAMAKIAENVTVPVAVQTQGAPMVPNEPETTQPAIPAAAIQ